MVEHISSEQRFPIGDLVEGNIGNFSPPSRTLARVARKDLIGITQVEPDVEIVDRFSPRVPDEVIEATEAVMKHSQGNFLNTWLYDHLSGKRNVLVTPEDRTRNPEIDFGDCIRVIEKHRDSLLEIEPDIPEIEIVQNLLKEIRSVTATNRIIYSVVTKETAGLSRVLILGSLISGGQHFYQETNGITPVTYALASSFDNLAAMGGELIKLRRQGYSLKHALAAMRIPALILATSWSLAPFIDQQFTEGNETLAGAIYGAESGICVTPSIAGALSMRKSYENLVSQEKVVNSNLKSLLEKENPTTTDKVKIFWAGSKESLKHDLIYPHHTGYYIGAAVGLALSTLTASITAGENTSWLQKPFVIGPLGIADSAGGAIASALTSQIYRIKLNRDLLKIAKKADYHG